MESKIKTFTDLRVWEEAHKLAIMVYKVSQKFPKEEQFGITNQIRRAVVSITSNITEGFGRRSMKDRIHFYNIALGSLNEVLSQLLISRDINYLDEGDWRDLEEKVIITSKMLNGFIKKSNSYIVTRTS